MEETFPFIIFAVYGIAAVVVVILLVYLIIRKQEVRKRENFEQRDN